jgi:hypothetical protein
MISAVPSLTVAGTSCFVLAQFAQLFAFFLPLKVLILLSSERIPHAFSGIITPDNRSHWLVAFSIATFVLYAASVFLQTFGNRTITKAVDQMLRGLGKLPQPERKKLRRRYTIYCKAHADAAVFLLGASALAFINPLVLIGVLFVLIVEFLITGWLYKNKFGGFLGWVGGGIERNVTSYIQYLSAVNFLSLFVLIVTDYFVSGGINVYLAILTMILGRQSLNALARFVKKMLALAKGVRLEEDEDDEDEETPAASARERRPLKRPTKPRS